MSSVSLIEHSDWLRRIKPNERREQDLEIVKLTREFAAALTYYYPEYQSTNAINRKAIQDLRSLVEKMDERLQSIVADEIVLPASIHLPFADILRQEVLKDTRFVLQTVQYNTDYALLGPIDPDLPTVLDEGYRGLCDINQDLLYKWDHERRQSSAPPEVLGQ